MSINETGAECTKCGDYNCTYLCLGCVIRLLMVAGLSLDKSIQITKMEGIYLDDYIIDEIKREIKTNEN